MRKITIILVLSAIISLGSFAQGRSFYELIPYRKGNRWGYCDTSKRITISPVYEQVEWFLNTPKKKLAIARKSGKFGVLDSDGNTVVPFRYDAISRSYEGPAYILQRGKKTFRYSIDSGITTLVTEQNSEPEYEALRPAKIDCKAQEAAIAFITKGKQVLVLRMKHVYAPDGQHTRVAWDTIYIQASEARNVACSNSSFYFKTENGWGVMLSRSTTSAEPFVPAVCDSLNSTAFDEFIGKKNGKWAVLQPLHKIATMPVYDAVEYYGHFYVIQRNGLWGILLPYLQKEVLIDPTHYGGYSLETLPGNEYLVVLQDQDSRLKGYVNFNNGLQYWD